MSGKCALRASFGPEVCVPKANRVHVNVYRRAGKCNLRASE
jgi:hypothetical protein